MSKIRTTTELIMRLKTNHIDLTDFDYKEGKTKDKYLESHPFISRGRRYYQNPHFFSVLFDQGLSDEVDFICNMGEFKPDYYVLTAFVVANNKIANRYISSLSRRFFIDNTTLSQEEKNKAMNDLMVDCAAENRLDIYKDLETIAKEGNIEPLYGNYANAGEGYCLYDACKYLDNEFAYYLLDNGADVTLNDSMAFPVACKETNYVMALELAKRGIDIHTKKDLGRMMIYRNDRLRKDITEENLKAKEELLKLYEESDKNELLQDIQQDGE